MSGCSCGAILFLLAPNFPHESWDKHRYVRVTLKEKMVIGGKESSCKVKAEKWKVSQKRWIKGVGVGI